MSWRIIVASSDTEQRAELRMALRDCCEPGSFAGSRRNS